METIRLGGDSDTNSAVVGGLLGAAVGLEELPSKLKKKVLKCDSAADDLKYRDTPKARSSYPHYCNVLDKPLR
jgi:ADP-ribosylglycohydrolase